MRAAILTAVLAALAGCAGGAKQPEFDALHPVRGTVSQGGKPVAGGAVQFQPDPDKPGFLINSEVGQDGTFSLSTVRTAGQGERKPGAPTGSYKVTYTPALGDQTSGYRDPVTLPKAVAVEAKDNDLKIELPTKK